MLQAEAPPAVPLWIHGRAFLTVAPAFRDVRNPASGAVLRRIPLCGRCEVKTAVDCALAALPLWAALAESERAAYLNTLSQALDSYAGHFTKLIAEESGMDQVAVEVEVVSAVAEMRDAVSGRSNDSPGVIAVIGDPVFPLLGPLRLAVPYLMHGSTVVFRPSPETPSALFALAELSGRCGIPAGVINIVHGDEVAADGLRAMVFALPDS